MTSIETTRAERRGGLKAGRRSVGHPIDVATGTVYLNRNDFSLPGRIDLVWSRGYSTANLDEPPTPLGRGWSGRYFVSLQRRGTEFTFRSPEGEVQVFSDADGTLEGGGVVRDLETCQELAQRGREYVVTEWDVETLAVERFVFVAGEDGVAWPLRRIENPAGDALELLYDKAGRLEGVRQRAERRLVQLAYNRAGQLTSVALAVSEQQRDVLVTYDYDRAGRLASVADALGNTDRYEYDREGRLVRERTKAKGDFRFDYDENGRCVHTAGVEGYDEKKLVFLDAGWIEVTDSRGGVRRYQCMESGQVAAEVSPLGAMQRTEYDEHGRIVARIDGKGGETRYAYDDRGNRCQITDAAGRQTSFEFNDGHQPTKVVDAAGGVWERVYDERGRWVAFVDPLGNRESYGHDERGNLVRITAANGASRQLVYGERNEVAAVVDGRGYHTQVATDAYGRVTAVVDPAGGATRAIYDELGNLVEVALPDGSRVRYEYDGAGHLTAFTDGAGHATRYSYGPCGRLLRRHDPLGGVVGYLWGREPNELLGLVNEKGERYALGYDAAGQLVEEVGFDGRTQTYTYDAAGYLLQHRDGKERVATFVRDPTGMLQKKMCADGTSSAYEYDAAGRLVRATAGEWCVELGYDAAGNLVEEKQNGAVIAHRYDAAGQRLATVLPSGETLAYAYDADGAFKTVALGERTLVEVRREERGLEVERRWGRQTARLTRSEYDPMGRLVRQLVGQSSSAVTVRSYGYDAAGNLTTFDDMHKGRRVYVYDAATRLAGAQGLASERFAFDPAGNLVDAEAVRQPGYVKGNRLLVFEDYRFEYDDAGNVVVEKKSQRTHRFAYDGQSQMVRAETADGLFEYRYDALGRRVKKRHGGKETTYLWAGNVLVGEASAGDASGSDAVTYVYEPGSFRPLCQVRGSEVYYYHNDHLGTPQELTDEDGKLVWSADYRAYGTVGRYLASDVENNLRFQGQYYDEETGLHYNRFRYYHPAAGRFTTTDPLGLRAGRNAYAYAPNPTAWVDPLGLMADPCGGKDAGGRARFEVTESGVAIPTNPAELRSNLSRLDDVSTDPLKSRKFTGTDSQGPVRVRVEKAHPDNPDFTGTPDPLHTVDHLHIDRRKNVTSGPWKSAEKVQYDWPF